jgi:hypothetical protein
MNNFFTIQNQHLENLGAELAVNYFRDLLWAEARRLNIPLNKINVSSRINVADGGVDANVEDSTIQSGLIKKRKTSYQIKTGKTFNPNKMPQIKKELFGTKPISKANLGNEVIECLDSNGTYILICFGCDFIDNEKRSVETNLKKCFKQCSYSSPKVEVWGQNQLISFFSMFPSLALRLNGRDNTEFQSHKTWSNESEMRRLPYNPNDKNIQVSNEIQRILRENRGNSTSTHIRLYGEAGAGKTRFILETTKAKELSPLVIYCNADKFRDSFLMNELLRDDNSFSIILILDECNDDNSSYIWNKVQYKGDRIKIVSITNEIDRKSGQTEYFEIKNLENQQVSSIIQTYVGQTVQNIDAWTEICGGFPRVAHIVGQNLLENPNDILRSPDTVNFWDRFIFGYEKTDVTKNEQIRLVLRHLSLFTKFGSQKLTPEFDEVWKLINSADTSITFPRFLEIVNHLKRRKILQGEYTLYISPKILHIKLWTEFWETYGGIQLGVILNRLSPSLRKWFVEMCQYARSSLSTQRIMQDISGANGFFTDLAILDSEIGGDFFLALSKADPTSSLNCLKRLIGNSTKEELVNFKNGRRKVVWALEIMSEWKDLFSDSARILLRLGEAENESYSNNASGIFVDLFSNAYGEVSPSEATPEQKIVILKEAFQSNSKEIRALALKACEKGLETQHFARMHGTHSEPFRPSPKRWMPKTWGEWFDAFRGVWSLVSDVIDILPDDEKKEAAKLLLNNSFGVGRYPHLAELVIDTIRALIDKSLLSNNEVLASITRLIWVDDGRTSDNNSDIMPVEVRQKWEDFRKKVEPKDFAALLERYIAFNLFEDKYSERKGFDKDQSEPIIENLAQQAFENQELLELELSWLITEKAKRGYDFGYALGKKDTNFELRLKLIKMYVDNEENKPLNLGFLSGYFRALHESNEEVWEGNLDTLAKFDATKVFIPALIQGSNLTEKSGIRLYELLEKGDIQFWELGRFRFGLQIQRLSEKTLKKWLTSLLLQNDAYATSLAIEFLDQFYIKDSSILQKSLNLPKLLTYQAITHKSLFDESQQDKSSQMSDFYWQRVAHQFINLFPEKSLDLANVLIQNFGKEGVLNRGLSESPKSILNELALKYPIEIWKIVSSQIQFPMNKTTLQIKFWLESCNLHFGNDINQEHKSVSLEELWSWIDEDIENRAWFVAWFVPSIISKTDDESPVARELLIRYGDREDVRNNLHANFGTTGVITGNMSNYYKGRLEEFNRLRTIEDNPLVLQWVDSYIDDLKNHIEATQIQEEREF